MDWLKWPELSCWDLFYIVSFKEWFLGISLGRKPQHKVMVELKPSFTFQSNWIWCHSIISYTMQGGVSDGIFSVCVVTHFPLKKLWFITNKTHHIWNLLCKIWIILMDHVAVNLSVSMNMRNICQNNNPPTSFKVGLTLNKFIQSTWFIKHTPMYPCCLISKKY